MKNNLKDYIKKRNFSKSKEPEPMVIKGKEIKRVFVIQRHRAAHLHYDFRLEIGRILKSWAVPKEIPLKENEKRLAIQVEDHPIEYADFHGVIPEGNYGAGIVEIWDKGTYELKDQTDNKIEVNLKGKKAKGNYMLIKTNFNKNKNFWLLMKMKD